MARPRKKGLEYFPHDVGARNDPKVKAMRHLFGNDGYVFLFVIYEMVFENNVGFLELKDKHMCTIIRKEIDVDQGLFDEMIGAAVGLGLFDAGAWDKRQVLTSKRIRSQIKTIEGQRKRKRLWTSKTPSKTGTETENETAEKCDKEKKRKEKKNIHKNISQGFKPKLFPIPGKVCQVTGCGLPAVYCREGEYKHYLCAGHMPDKVKAVYDA